MLISVGTPIYKWASQSGMNNLSQPISNTTTTGEDENVRGQFGSMQAAGTFASSPSLTQSARTECSCRSAPQFRSTSPLSNFISGTSETGHYERLDPSKSRNQLARHLLMFEAYFMRTGSDARSFWKVGRVFAMLYTEAAGNAARMNGLNDAFSIVRFGETVYSQIRRFVVVSVRRQFVYAL